jgi:hypothetical protein
MAADFDTLPVFQSEPGWKVYGNEVLSKAVRAVSATGKTLQIGALVGIYCGQCQLPDKTIKLLVWLATIEGAATKNQVTARYVESQERFSIQRRLILTTTLENMHVAPDTLHIPSEKSDSEGNVSGEDSPTSASGSDNEKAPQKNGPKRCGPTAAQRAARQNKALTSADVKELCAQLALPAARDAALLTLNALPSKDLRQLVAYYGMHIPQTTKVEDLRVELARRSAAGVPAPSLVPQATTSFRLAPLPSPVHGTDDHSEAAAEVCVVG